jgi:hypothetical protein
MNYDKILANIFFIDDWHINQSYLNKYKRHYKKKDKYQNIINYIDNRYIDSTSFKETIYRIKHNCEVRPKCKTCGNDVEFIGKNNILFRQYCCNRCSGINKDTINKKQQSDKEKHCGILGWNISSENKVNSRKNTLISKYGNWENACIELEKLRQNSVYKKYGVKSLMDLEEVKTKRIKTIKENYSYNNSIEENKAFNILTDFFGKDNVIRQYCSKKYPWACDFYIVDIDLYIECHFSHFHNYKPYTGDNDDLNEIELLKQKSTNIKNKKHVLKTQYDNIIYTWTNLDVRKRNKAIENKLNYMEFYNLKELEKWINKMATP